MLTCGQVKRLWSNDQKIFLFSFFCRGAWLVLRRRRAYHVRNGSFQMGWVAMKASYDFQLSREDIPVTSRRGLTLWWIPIKSNGGLRYTSPTYLRYRPTMTVIWNWGGVTVNYWVAMYFSACWAKTDDPIQKTKKKMSSCRLPALAAQD